MVSRSLAVFLLVATCYAQRTYNGVHDYSAVTKSAIQGVGGVTGAFNSIIDTDFYAPGVPVVRVTDRQTCVGTDTSLLNKSWPGNSSSEDIQWNSDSTMFNALNIGNSYTIFVVNPATFPAPGSVTNLSTRSVATDTSRNCFSASFHAMSFDAQWSTVNPHIQYGHGPTNDINALDVTTGAWTPLINGNTFLSAFTGMTEFSMSRVGDHFMSFIGGGTIQDTNTLIGIVQTGSTPWTSPATLIHTLNVFNNTLDGVAFTPQVNSKLHNARISPTGQYVKFGTTTNGSWVWDITNGTVTKLNINAVAGQVGNTGHSVWGFGGGIIGYAGDQQLVVNTSFNNPIPPDWSLYPAANPTVYTDVMSNLAPGIGSWLYDTHPSWLTSTPVSPLEAMLLSTDRDGTSDTDATVAKPLGTEIIAIHTNGTGFDRMLWNRAFQNTAGSSNCNANGFFECTTRGAVSPNGLWFVWSSNWESSLGPDISGFPRIDMFVAKLPLIAAASTKTKSKSSKIVRKSTGGP